MTYKIFVEFFVCFICIYFLLAFLKNPLVNAQKSGSKLKFFVLLSDRRPVPLQSLTTRLVHSLIPMKRHTQCQNLKTRHRKEDSPHPSAQSSIAAGFRPTEVSHTPGEGHCNPAEGDTGRQVPVITTAAQLLHMESLPIIAIWTLVVSELRPPCHKDQAKIKSTLLHSRIC